MQKDQVNRAPSYCWLKHTLESKVVFLCQCRVDFQVKTFDAEPELMSSAFGLSCILLPSITLQFNLQQQWHSLSQGGSDQAAAASLDKVVPVSCYVLETLLLHLFSEVGRTEKEEDRMLGDSAHTTCYQGITCGILKANILQHCSSQNIAL